MRYFIIYAGHITQCCAGIPVIVREFSPKMKGLSDGNVKCQMFEMQHTREGVPTFRLLKSAHPQHHFSGVSHSLVIRLHFGVSF